MNWDKLEQAFENERKAEQHLEWAQRNRDWRHPDQASQHWMAAKMLNLRAQKLRREARV
jgi:hypothetical protein